MADENSKPQKGSPWAVAAGETKPLTTDMLKSAFDSIMQREPREPYCIQAPGYAEKQTKRLLESESTEIACVFCGGAWVKYNGEVHHVHG